MPSTPNSNAGIPADIYQAARQVYNLQHIYLLIGDQYEKILAQADLRLLDPYSSWNTDLAARLALVTAFQFAESIPDRVASDASRKRIDWKYALRLPVHHQGLDPLMLCAFRQSLLASNQALGEFERLLEALGKTGLYARAEHEQISARAVVVTVCKITRLHELQTGMKAALVSLSASAPDWLFTHMPPYWYTRYQTGPLSQQASAHSRNLEEEAARFGADIHFLNTALREHGPAQLLDLPEIQHISRLFEAQFLITGGQTHWQPSNCGTCAIQRLGETGT